MLTRKVQQTLMILENFSIVLIRFHPIKLLLGFLPRHLKSLSRLWKNSNSPVIPSLPLLQEVWILQIVWENNQQIQSNRIR